MEFKSIDELKKAMERARQETNGNVQLKDLFNDKFMRQFTKCSNFEDFCEKGKIPTDVEEFEKFPDEKMDEAVKELSNFNSWKDMQIEAAKARFIGNMK